MLRRSKPTRRGGAFALAALVVWAFPAAAHAAPESDATIRTDRFTLNSRAIGDGQVTCPSGTRVVGGGVSETARGLTSIAANGPLDENGEPSALADGDVGRSWYARVWNEGPDTNTYVVAAICSAGSDATIETDSFTINRDNIEDAQAVCPAGTRVIGGGFVSTYSAHGAVHTSGPLDDTGLTSNLNDGDVGRSWYAKVQSTGEGTDTFVTAAICSAGSDATIRTESFTVAPGETGDGRASCDGTSRIVGGGVTSTGSTESFVLASGPLDETGLSSNLAEGDIGRSWHAAIVNNSGSPNTYVATAICVSPAPTPTPPTTTPPTCNGKTATIFAEPDSSIRKFTGTAKKDVIVGTSGADRIKAGGGNDLVCGGAGKDRIYGQAGRDKLLGQGGKDLLSGGGKDDACLGGAGKDVERSC